MNPRTIAVLVLCTIPLAGCGKGPTYEGKSVRQLRKELKNPSAEVRANAALGLGELGLNAKDAVKDLIDVLKDPNDDVRMRAMNALWAIGPDAKLLLPEVLDALGHDQDPRVRSSAAGFLADMGTKGSDVVSPLAKALSEDAQKDVRYAAVRALIKLGRHAKAGIPALVKALKDPEYDIRNAAVQALAEMGKEGKIAIPSLTEMTNHAELAEPDYVQYAIDRLQQN